MSVHGKSLAHESKADVTWLVESVTRMVRPVVRLCVGRMSCNAFVNVIKRVYVEESTQHLEREDPGKKVTKSALALLTGLDSRAVDGIMQEGSELLSSADIRPEAAILEAWGTDATYRDPDSGKPKVLPIYGKGLTFQTLVSRAAGRNVTCQTVLDKLTHTNHIRILDDTYVELLNRYYSSVKATEKVIFEAGSFAVGRLAKTVSHNLEKDDPANKWLQQEMWSVKIPYEKLGQLRAEIRALIEENIQGSERVIEPYEDPVKTSAHCSAGVGWYYWETNPE